MCFKRMTALLLTIGAIGLMGAAPVLTMRMIPGVAYTTPARLTYEKRINASGTIEASVVREVYLETPVIARRVDVSVGDHVYKNQVLAEIDAKLTQSVLERSVPVSLSGQLSEVEMQDAQGLEELFFALQGSGLASDPDMIEQIQQVYGASVQQEPVQDGYIYIPDKIIAPIDGIVTEVSIKKDMLARTAGPALTIYDPSSFAAMVTVGESFISDVRIGDKAILEGTGFSGKQYTGYVSKIYPVARRTAGVTAQETVVDVEITIENPDSDLKAGFTTRAEILTDVRRDMLTVPYEAVRQDANNVEYVYVVQDSRVVRRNIETGLELLEGVEVVKGLEASDVLVADASAVDREGARVFLKESRVDAD